MKFKLTILIIIVISSFVGYLLLSNASYSEELIPEWYEHQSCLVAWPCNHELYGNIISEAKQELGNVIHEIAKTEHVILLSNKENLYEIES